MTYHKDWEPTPAAADRFQADLEAAVANGERARKVAEYRERKLNEAVS